MRELFLIMFLCFGLSATTKDLFDGIKFDEQGIGYKTNILVIYQEIGKAGNESDIKKLEKDFRTTTALAFIYNNKEYYISIEEKHFPNFLFSLKDGDLILIDIVVFNTTECYSTGRSNKTYCSYINKIQKQ
ncbi:MAG: hypothetical protein LBB53_02835 [Prevotellaceae bacterium]|nr:hypothetical protein [Prevotellaceae bacterium]